MVKQDFVTNVMQEQDLRYFAVLNPNLEMVYTSFQPLDLATAQKRLQSFFDSAQSGVYYVKLYQNNKLKVDGTPRGEGLTFEIMINPSLKEKDPLPPVPGESGMGGLGGNANNAWMDRFLGSKDSLAELRMELIKHQLQADHDRKIRELEEAHKKAMEEKENRWEERIMGIASTVAPDLLKSFGGGKPMNGVGATETEPETKTETNKNPNMNNEEIKKQRILTALNTLVSVDADFADNLEKLARLAKTNPMVYKQAVKMLNSMS